VATVLYVHETILANSILKKCVSMMHPILEDIE
jgi:hypothetical protein